MHGEFFFVSLENCFKEFSCQTLSSSWLIACVWKIKFHHLIKIMKIFKFPNFIPLIFSIHVNLNHFRIPDIYQIHSSHAATIIVQENASFCLLAYYFITLMRFVLSRSRHGEARNGRKIWYILHRSLSQTFSLVIKQWREKSNINGQTISCMHCLQFIITLFVCLPTTFLSTISSLILFTFSEENYLLH